GQPVLGFQQQPGAQSATPGRGSEVDGVDLTQVCDVPGVTEAAEAGDTVVVLGDDQGHLRVRDQLAEAVGPHGRVETLQERLGEDVGVRLLPADRKSTRLNSSHVKISYAVFCLKKKKKPAKVHGAG